MQQLLVMFALLLSVNSYAQSFIAPTKQEHGAEYLIITHDRYHEIIRPFVQWKYKKGISTKVVRLSEIGENKPELIKDYISNAYYKWKIVPVYVLIVGDIREIKPYPHPVIGSSDNPYADVDNDTIQELQIGRLPCQNKRQLKSMLAKIFNYERTPSLTDTMFYKKATTIRQDPGPYHNAGVNFVRAMILCFSDFSSVDTFVNPAHNHNDVRDSLQVGRGYIFYTGHSAATNWPEPFKVNPYINNKKKTPVIFSWSCRTVLQQNYIGQKWLKSGSMRNPKGGVAFVGTTSSGLYARYRNFVARNFFRAIFADKVLNIGSALKQGLDSLWTYSPDSFGRVLYSEFNLLGDPSMNLWTSVPRTFQVRCDTVISSGPQTFNVSVTSPDGKQVETALVCLSAAVGDDFYYTGYTDNNGLISFEIDPTGYDSIWMTITAQNFIPYEKKFLITGKQTQIAQAQTVSNPGCFTIYPNPAKSYINIKYQKSNIKNKNKKLKIYNVAGKIIKRLEGLRVDELSISLDGISPGIYFVNLESEKKKETQRLIIIP
jgi:hypothetical protein